jgi:hypothetical protein
MDSDFCFEAVPESMGFFRKDNLKKSLEPCVLHIVYPSKVTFNILKVSVAFLPCLVGYLFFKCMISV